MEDQRSPESDFNSFIDPENLTNWLSTNPKSFWVIMARMISEEISTIRIVARYVENHPNVDAAKDIKLSETLTLKELMLDITKRTERIQRVLKTGLAYMNAYEAGKVTPSLSHVMSKEQRANSDD